MCDNLRLRLISKSQGKYNTNIYFELQVYNGETEEACIRQRLGMIRQFVVTKKHEHLATIEVRHVTPFSELCSVQHQHERFLLCDTWVKNKACGSLYFKAL